MTPFEALYGRPPLVCMAYEEGSSSNDLVDMELKKRDKILKQLKRNLDQAQEQMNKYFNKGQNIDSFKLGDWVYVKYM